MSQNFLHYCMVEITVQSKKRIEFIDVTAKVREIVTSSGVANGRVYLYVPHTTAAITINEGADPSVQRDILTFINKLVPENGNYHHMEGNSDAHIKASVFGCSETILIQNHHLVLGTWQHIFFFEGDGPRTRKIVAEVIAH